MFKISFLAPIVISLLGTVAMSGCTTSQPSEAIKTTEGTSVTIDTDIIVTGLDTPWAIDFAPDGRIFMTERPGRVRIVKNG